MNQQELDLFAERYYRSPDPGRAPEAVECLAKLGHAQRDNPVWYFFARIAQDHPAMLRDYEELFRASPSCRALLLRVLAQAGDYQTLQFLQRCVEDPRYSVLRDELRFSVHAWSPGQVRPLRRRAATPYDLDILWFEFLATGEIQAILGIIDVLEERDRVRERLHDYLHPSSRPGMFARLWRDRTFRKLAGAGILIDPGEGAIVSTQDLDCHCALEAGNVSRTRLTRFRRILPFALSEEELGFMLVKAAAKWSLGTNAGKHPLVLHTCETESAKRVGRCRISLLEIAAHAGLATNDVASAFNRLNESVTPDPLERQRRTESAERDLRALAKLTQTGPAARVKPAPLDMPSSARRKCAAVTGGASSYCAELTFGARHGSSQDDRAVDGALVFRLDFVKPASCRVFQTAGADCDEWVTVCGKTFRAPAWSEKACAGNEASLNELLLVDKYVAMLRHAEPLSADLCETEQTSYIVLKYGDAALSYLPGALLHGALPIVEKAFLWIDSQTNYLVKAEFQFLIDVPDRTRQEASIVHCFAAYNAPIVIAPPGFQLLHLG